VTAFGLLFTPAFYTFVRKLGSKDLSFSLPAKLGSGESK